ncbi:MAG: hypothetical protein SNI58_09335 [Rikenellaceae bacterium]
MPADKMEVDSIPIIVEIDSIALIIEERKNVIFANTIFAGATFGMSENSFKQKAEEYKKLYGNYIFVSLGSDVKKKKILAISPKYYKNRLSELFVYVDNHEVYGLSRLFQSKYGETYNAIWEYKDIFIKINGGFRRIYPNPTNSTRKVELYYESIFGGGTALTQNPHYTIIHYKSKVLEKEELRDKAKQDSLRRLEIESKKQEDIKSAELQNKYI